MSQTKERQQHDFSLLRNYRSPCPRYVSHSVGQKGLNGESIVILMLDMVVGLLRGTEAK